mmetsp:Transcript_41556/g.73025  ORF Transcript_41556/g.73025 Transcript_41556/m.73025 type:complete len:875 (-) Transcript_41556:42-2666(-)
MQILRPVFLLPFLVRAIFGLYAFGERDSHQHSLRDAPKKKLRPSATLLRTGVRLQRDAQLSQKTAVEGSAQRAGANITLDTASDELEGILDEVTARITEVQSGLEKVHDVCVDLMSRAGLREAFQRQELEIFQQERQMKMQEVSMRKATLAHLEQQESKAKDSYDSSIAQRAKDIDKYLDSNKSLVEQKVVFAKVLELLNQKKALVTKPKDYSENFSYVPTSVVPASSMDYVIGIIQNLQSTAASKSTETDSKFATSDTQLATLVASFKQSLQDIDEAYFTENSRMLEAEAAFKTATIEKGYRALFIAGEENLEVVWQKVCGNLGRSNSLSGCWVSPDASAAPTNEPFTVWQSGDNFYATQNGFIGSLSSGQSEGGFKGSGTYKDGKVNFEWKALGKPLAEVSINDIWWDRVSASDCHVKTEYEGLVGQSLPALTASLAEFKALVNSTLSSMDSLPMVQTLLQTNATRALHRRQPAAETAAGRRDELLRLAREVQTRRAHPEATAVPAAPPLRTKPRPAKPLLRVAARPQPAAQPSLEVRTADLALHLLLGASERNAGKHAAASSRAANTSETDAMDQVVADCLKDKQAETDKILAARKALRAAQTQNLTASFQESSLNDLYLAIAEQKGMFTKHSEKTEQAFLVDSLKTYEAPFSAAMGTAISEMDTIKSEVDSYIAAGGPTGPTAASGVLTSIATIKARLTDIKAKTESDVSQILSIYTNELSLKYAALTDQVHEEALDLIKTMEKDQDLQEGALAEITKQQGIIQAAVSERETIEYKCQPPGSCGVLRYQQCCGENQETKFEKLVTTWDECAKHCEATLAAGHAVVGCEMASDDKSSPGYCSAMTKCTMTAETRKCAGSRCKPAHLAIGET